MDTPSAGSRFCANSRFTVLLSVHLLWIGMAWAQTAPADSTADPQNYPRFLSNSYVGLQIGYIDYPFSTAQLNPGFHVQSIEIPHLAPRVFLFGHEFNKYFSVQISDTRPIQWVAYHGINGDQGPHTVWMNIAGLTGKARLPVGRRFGVFGEAGLGIVTRKGFMVGPAQVVNDASYATVLFGGGLDYRLNDSWSLLTEVTAAPGHAKDNQPRTIFVSGGFNYTLRHLPSIAAESDSTAPMWPKNMVQIGYSTNAFGYGVNDFVSSRPVPIFWTGSIEAAHGIAIDYRRNVFHSSRFFAFDWGASFAGWTSRNNGERFYTASVYPVFRVPLIRTNPVEFYVSYSLAGPTIITRTTIDGFNAGKHFTFQDYMSAGVFLGRKRTVSAELRIAHYSNGNLFPQNPGVTIPLSFYLGSTF